MSEDDGPYHPPKTKPQDDIQPARKSKRIASQSEPSIADTLPSMIVTLKYANRGHLASTRDSATEPRPATSSSVVDKESEEDADVMSSNPTSQSRASQYTHPTTTLSQATSTARVHSPTRPSAIVTPPGPATGSSTTNNAPEEDKGSSPPMPLSERRLAWKCCECGRINDDEYRMCGKLGCLHVPYFNGCSCFGKFFQCVWVNGKAVPLSNEQSYREGVSSSNRNLGKAPSRQESIGSLPSNPATGSSATIEAHEESTERSSSKPATGSSAFKEADEQPIGGSWRNIMIPAVTRMSWKCCTCGCINNAEESTCFNKRCAHERYSGGLSCIGEETMFKCFWLDGRPLSDENGDPLYG